MRVQLKRGLDVPIEGAPRQVISGELAVGETAHTLTDYGDVRARALVEEGDRVALGEGLLFHRRYPDMLFTAQCAGIVRRIEHSRGRRISRIVVEREGVQAAAFPQHDETAIANLAQEDLRSILLSSGAWTAIRARPYDRIAQPDITPRAILITAIDSNPLAPDPQVIIEDSARAFTAGVTALSRLTTGTTYVCTRPGVPAGLPDDERLVQAEFDGPHPAGLPGTHLHALGLTIGMQPDLWHVGYQDVIAIGELLLSGRVSARRVIAIAGPAADKPRLVRTSVGASLAGLHEITADPASCTVISGSPLHGTTNAPHLGRFHNQVTLMPAAQAAQQTGLAGFLRTLVSGLRTPEPARAAGNDWPAGMLPVEVFEQVWPFSTPPIALLRALLAGDTDGALRLGCAGLGEEDLALCAYVCPSRCDYAAALRTTLQQAEKLA